MAERREKPIGRGCIFVGIDPGKEGYIAAVDSDGVIVSMASIPYLEDEPDIATLRRLFLDLHHRGAAFVLVERQQPFHREGPVGAFTNGFGYGVLKACLAWSGIPHDAVKPDLWKREIGLAVPSVPAPSLPPKPVQKGKTLKEWEKKVAGIQQAHGRKKQRARKDLAVRMAQQLAPGHDFRASPRALKPHEGKCEAFLLARLALKRSRGR